MRRKLKRIFSLLLIAILVFQSGLILAATEDEGNKQEGDQSTKVVFHETFKDGQGVVNVAGNAKLIPVSDLNFDGNEDGNALHISERANDYDGADIKFSDVGMENGKTYTITVTGYIDDDVVVPEGAQAYLQIPSGSYPLLGNADYAAGKAFNISTQYTVDTSTDSTLRIQSNKLGDTVPFYVGDILIELIITDDEQEPDDPKENESTVYHETFDNGQGVATQAGDAKLSPVSDLTFDGNEDGKSIYVNGRSNNWDGVDIKFGDVGMEDGKKYSILVTGYVAADSNVPEGAQAYLQIPSGDYPLLGSTNFIAGESFTINGEYTVNSSTDSVFRIQSNEEGNTVSFYIGDILITENAASEENEEGPGEPREPAREFNTITFEDQTLGGFEPRGDSELLTVSNEANHTDGGSYALKVENRTKAWNGPALHVEKFIDKGHEYKISAWVKLSSGSAQLQLSTQIGDGGGASYNNIQGKTISAEDGWVQLEGTYRYDSVGGEFVTIYVESSNHATASFYIDDITFEPTGSGTVGIERNLTPIKDVYKDYFLIGNAVSLKDMEGIRLELLKMHHNLVTAENAMKPGEAYNDKGELDFTDEDQLVKQVLEQGLKLHGHVLVWHQQSNESLHTGQDGQPLNRGEALKNLRNHVEATVKHFGKNVISWDVVNEAMNDNPPNPTDWKGSLRQSGWLKAIGPDYLKEAFIAAREVLDENGWDIKLYYNDYNDDNQNKAEAIYQMVKEINDEYAEKNNGKLLIDGIGMQGHYNLNTNPENVRLSLEKFISLGVEVGITELDITAGTNNVLTEKQANQQAYLYAQLFQLYKEHAEHISRVTFWGLNDATSWRAAQSPLLFDNNMQVKPAYYAVIDPDKFIAEYVPDEKEVNHSEALYGTPDIDGKIDDIWKDTPKLNVNRYQTAWHGANGIAKVLWDEEHLYVLFEVSDSELDKSSTNPWEQDSVEVFLDENNAKTPSYQDDDGQYRVNFDNETSFNPESITKGFESAASKVDKGYTVEMKIPFKSITPKKDMKIGFDAQINDAKDGARQGVAIWNDLTGQGYQDPSVFGVLTLVKSKSEEPDPENPEVPEKPSKTVIVKPTVIDNEVKINDADIEKLANNGRLIIDISDHESSVRVILTASQIKILKEKNAVIEIRKNDVIIQIPAAIFEDENEPVYIDIEKMADIYEALSSIYDFRVFQGEKEITTFDIPVTLSFTVDKEKVNNTDDVKVYYWNPNNEKWEKVGGNYSDGLITVDVNHFSVYTVFEAKAGEVIDPKAPVEEEKGEKTRPKTDSRTPKTEDGNKLPKTASNVFNSIMIGFFLILFGAAVFLLSKRKRA